MEKTYKRVPFDIELAKKIQSGEITGRIVTNHDMAVTLVDAEYRFDVEYNIPVIWHWETGHNELVLYNSKGECRNSHSDCYLHIELPEETPKQLNGLAGCDGQCHSCTNDCTQRKYDVWTHNFKTGDKVTFDGNECIYEIAQIKENFAILDHGKTKITIVPLHDLTLYKEKHEFKQFDKVLVRDDAVNNCGIWSTAYYSHYEKDEDKYSCGGILFDQCIPYEGNEHLVGTTDKPKEK